MAYASSIDITLKCIESAHKNGIHEVYIWTVDDEYEFLRGIRNNPYVRDVLYDNRGRELSRHSVQANALRDALELHGFKPGQGYVAILR